MIGRKKDDELSRTIGRHDAQLEHQQGDITDLKQKMDASERRLRDALKDWKSSADKYRQEANKTIWMRRGFVAALVFIFAVWAWLMDNDKHMASELINWIFHSKSGG